MPPEYVQIAGVAKILGVHRDTALRYARRPDFPKPIPETRELTRGRVWRASAVERWGRKHLVTTKAGTALPRKGRPRKDG